MRRWLDITSRSPPARVTLREAMTFAFRKRHGEVAIIRKEYEALVFKAAEPTRRRMARLVTRPDEMAAGVPLLP